MGCIKRGWRIPDETEVSVQLGRGFCRVRNPGVNKKNNLAWEGELRLLFVYFRSIEQKLLIELFVLFDFFWCISFKAIIAFETFKYNLIADIFTLHLEFYFVFYPQRP